MNRSILAARRSLGWGASRICSGVGGRAYSNGPPRRSSSFTGGFFWGTTGCVASFVALYIAGLAPGRKLDENRRQLSDLPVVAVDPAVDISSPVKVLDLEAANKKIRQSVHAFSFESSKDGTTGRVDVARVSSNNPVEDNWATALGKGPGKEDMVYAGVYDGHAGWATSTVLSQALIPHVSSALAKLDAKDGSAIDDTVKAAFKELDDKIMNHAKAVVETHNPGDAEALSALAPAVAGSCALLSMYDPSTSILRTAVAGDSRAVLGSWSSRTGAFSAEALSVDQNGFNSLEVARLNAAHPGEEDMLDPRTGRLLGMAITRSFGDHRWKYPLDFLLHLEDNFFDTGPRPRYKTPPYMTAEPEVTTRQISTDDFVIMATDGLWDHISNEDAVSCVSRWLAAKKAGQPERVESQEGSMKMMVAREGFGSWRATPEYFAIEDMDNAAVCLIKNAFGGTRRNLFRGVMTEMSPRSRYVRDDVTVQSPMELTKAPYLSSLIACATSVLAAAANMTTLLDQLTDSWIRRGVDFGFGYSEATLYTGVEASIGLSSNASVVSWYQSQIDEGVVNDDGTIRDWEYDFYSLDEYRIGNNLLWWYERTDEIKYKTAADTIRSQLDRHPRNPSGGFWHRAPDYPNQMWLDGIFMADSFYAKWTSAFEPDNTTAWDDIALQYDLIEEHCRNSTSELLVHGYDDSKEAVWADPVTGASPLVWSRSVGWYFISLAEALGYFPEDNDAHARLLGYFVTLAEGLKKAYENDGGWWLVMSEPYPGEEGNYIESSAHAMFTYGLFRGIRQGLIDEADYGNVAVEAYEYLTDKFITANDDGTLNFIQTVEVGSLKSNATYEVSHSIQEG
ncbi:hypothetical protein GMORB2_7258 [Geosmithia morbida]|uniref:PPM-type phosphatase domain-containing protein n=1 Tax=Geosmithia morbida TaxID=1094350 RepID=A0A9P5D380_9HYPO|nr:uncharacterized protein GMORB2_7258 [Geosmithia morbida]KAF4122266.1 hypothetical protein GMORB2_7258 [Geosmithia morbida]